MLNILNIVPDTIVDGPRVRTSFYLSGCKHACKGCHNKSSWIPKTGKDYEYQELIDLIKQYGHNRLTLSGGDPLSYQATETIEFLKELHSQVPEINVWLYAGYLYEDILVDPERKEVLKYIDVLVDGKFEESLKSKNCLFRGSTNQRLIDIPKSLKQGEIVLYEH